MKLGTGNVSAAKQRSASKQVDVPMYKCAANVSAPADGRYPEYPGC